MAARRSPSLTTPKNSRAVTEAIARETQRPIEEVERIYQEALRELASDAKITQYLGVLASRRARMRLRQH